MLAATVFVECENFKDLGGWAVETQSMRQLGSSYVMAHGYGKRVADAKTATTPSGRGRATGTPSGPRAPRDASKSPLGMKNSRPHGCRSNSARMETQTGTGRRRV